MDNALQAPFHGPESSRAFLDAVSEATRHGSAPFNAPAATDNTSGLKTQLAISITLGLGSFLTFCVLRTRWTVMFAPRTNLRRHTPPVLSSTFFGWIPQLLRIPEAEVLECVGLDAVMMLRFFTMAAKLFATCLIPGILIILPITSFSTDDSSTNDPRTGDPSLPGKEPRPGMSLLYLFTHFTFTWLFSLITLYAIWHTYEGYIAIRRAYLLKRHKSITNRTIMVVGLPIHLQSDRALATFYESLDVGTVESAHVCRHVTALKRLIEQRAHALRALENVYTDYYGNPSGSVDYDPEQIMTENDRTEQENAQPGENIRRGSSGEAGANVIRVNGKIKKRPTIRLGFLGIFGKKVDKIDYCRDVFATLDKAVQKLRMSRIFATTSIGFVTFEDMHAAQILAQTVNTQETLSCETTLAPEPRDVYWDNLNLPPSELGVRTVVINVIVFFLIFFWAGPVGVFSSFLSLASLDKIFPGISKLAGAHPLLKSVIQGFLPTVGVIIFLAVVPTILLALCKRQGIQSHSEIAQSLFNKYFVFILFNVVLVFTIVGTWAQAVNKVYHNLGELTLLLAVSLPRVAPFFVNYTILRGIGLFPLQLLQIADVFRLVFQGFFSKTPRDYAEARAPPELPYGIVYSNATLAFVIILIYSCIKPLILVFGVIYFAIGYLVFKYQLLYVYFHPNESGGQTWPMVYNRIMVGLLIFQNTMLGFFMLKQAFFFGVLMVPLPAGTLWFWYWTTNMYKLTARYIPLELLRPAYTEDDEEQGEEHLEGYDEAVGTLVNNSLAALGSGAILGQAAVLEADDPKKAKANNSRRSVNISSEGECTIDVGNNIGQIVSAVRRKLPKSVVDDDDYEAVPDRFTDYRQPPMTLYNGVLNSGMRHYCHPALAGPLPTLWLPLRRDEGPATNNSKRLSTTDEESRVEGFGRRSSEGPGILVGTRDSDQPQTYDQADNLVGGGQDENLSASPMDENPFISQVLDRAGQEPASPAAAVFATTVDDSDNSSDVTGGPSPPGTPTAEGGADAKRNPAVEGIADVYYHHPERRMSTASSSSNLRRGFSVSSMGPSSPGGGVGSAPPRSLPARGSRASLLRLNSSSLPSHSPASAGAPSTSSSSGTPPPSSSAPTTFRR
ncbi:calcium permeable stress-gated cation channel [Entomortierella parvispora]|uniref:Calcium permeable stress-gated cation channel n=1 Tax=Entomortierella parvispora TaxID=205924 RepID=A0A9P3HHL8_9FUNG|nr:calcium permeable stress-gated cation channel [Entomortierella parvispora]